MRYGLSGASLATFGDKILISGGVGVGGILKAVKRLLVYDIRTNEWLKGPSMNQVSFFFVKNKRSKILKVSLDSCPSPSPSVKIQIMGGKVCLRCIGKTLLGFVNKLFVITSSKLPRQQFEFSLKVKVIGLNPCYLLFFVTDSV